MSYMQFTGYTDPIVLKILKLDFGKQIRRGTLITATIDDVIQLIYLASAFLIPMNQLSGYFEEVPLKTRISV